MGILDKFEQAMERLFEGTSTSLFRQKLTPAELGKRLERQMLGHQPTSVGTTIVPNLYVVRLHPQDFADIGAATPGMARHMESILADAIDRHGATLLEHLQISLKEDSSVRRREVRITSSLGPAAGMQQVPRARAPHRRSSAPPRVDQTAMFAPASRQPSSRFYFEVVEGDQPGQRFEIREGSMKIGRALSNDIVIADPYASRSHASLELSARGIRISDLNSTHGTRVNGEPVRLCDLFPGNRITIGRTTLALHMHADDRT